VVVKEKWRREERLKQMIEKSSAWQEFSEHLVTNSTEMVRATNPNNEDESPT
jgi:hypothetical protein